MCPHRSDDCELGNI